ncbi:hypothetical protein GC169_11095 [bacterium]|nr:hypothetical protein [bacterium]
MIRSAIEGVPDKLKCGMRVSDVDPAKVTIGPSTGFDEETLTAVTSGRVDPAVRLFIETAAAMRGCDEPAADALAGALLESEIPADMGADALEKALAAIDESDRAIRSVSRSARLSAELSGLPEGVRSAVLDAEAAAGWRYAGPGIRVLPLDLGGSASAEILRISAGAAAPRHSHKGMEYTLCLIGGFNDGPGSYGPGDVSVADPDVTHRPVADDDGPCFVLAVTDDDLKLTGFMGVLQRLVGG